MVKKSIFVGCVFSIAFVCVSSRADTVTFQQGIGGYSGTYDTWLDSDDYDTNYGSDEDIHVRHDSYGTINERTNLIKFNVSSLPANAVITSASLSLLYYDDYNISSNDSLTVAAYRLIKPWTEGTGGSGNGRTGAGFYLQNAYPDTTQWWNGGARGVNHDRWATPDASVTLYDIGGSYAWETWSGSGITASVAAWYANPSQNYGWVMDYTAYSDSYDGVIFHSSEYSTSPADYVWRPKLQIDYYITPEPATISLLVVGGLAGLVRRKG
jgi:hypothetical protein